MSWSKLKQQMESFLSPALYGRVEYRATSLFRNGIFQSRCKKL